MGMQLLKKIGAKQILGNITKVLEGITDDQTAVDVYTVIGKSNGIKTGVGTFGEYFGFLGTFEAVNHITGEVMTTTRCYIQEPLSTILVNAMSSNDEIEFAYTVAMKRRDDLERGYEWMVKPHTAVTQSDTLSHLRKLALPNMAEPETKAEPKLAPEPEKASETATQKGKKK